MVPRAHSVWTCASVRRFSLVAPVRVGTPACSRTHRRPGPVGMDWRAGCLHCPAGRSVPAAVVSAAGRAHGAGPRAEAAGSSEAAAGPPRVGRASGRPAAETWRGWPWET